jgi:outer membrane lipoprotein-sorting protein
VIAIMLILAAAIVPAIETGPAAVDFSTDEKVTTSTEYLYADAAPQDPKGCAVGCAGCTANCAARPRPSMKDVKKNLSKSYSDLLGLSMFFKQVNSWVDMPDAGEVSKGTLWASGGNRLRMEYSDPEGHLLVSDGKRAWVYVPENKQAVVDSFGVGEHAALGQMILNFLGSGTAKLEEDEEVRRVNCHVVSVENVTDPPGLKSVKIWVDPRVWLARGLELTDLNDNVTTFTFWNVKKLKKVDAALFTFEAPPGVEIVESPLGAGDS